MLQGRVVGTATARANGQPVTSFHATVIDGAASMVAVSEPSYDAILDLNQTYYYHLPQLLSRGVLEEEK